MISLFFPPFIFLCISFVMSTKVPRLFLLLSFL
ncbi:MAG: hypothetical protein [Siphoviridae sp. ctpQM7]|nr:MAG: hypothetical protein [Siphoviridae sp. ctpQM7]